MVLNRLQKQPRVDFLTDISKGNAIKFFISDPKTSSSKNWKGSMANDVNKVQLINFCLINGRNLNV